VASGEEMTAGEADLSEIFTVCPDVALDDPRVRAAWPCHGPVPWPDAAYRDRMGAVTDLFGAAGERLLRLVALGLGLDGVDTLSGLTAGGWHHMRVLRFPCASARGARGIGAHTDYGLLVIAAQDDVGGLWVRPPVAGEARARNWREGETSAGKYEHDEPWTFVQPVPHVLTVFPGDLLQFMTGGRLLSTPHKVRLAARERFALAYFHEPNFQAVARPLFDPADGERVHYGTHFTRMFARCYPDRITTARLAREDRWAVLARLREEAAHAQAA
jgi:2-oxoglutarate dioxygenase / 2-oxoglutarate/L-arginine monooxygenase/decarboxylase